MRPLRFLPLTSLLVMTLCSPAIAGNGTLTPQDPRPKAPGFELRDIEGNTVTLKDFRGAVLVVNFWASWCPPCLEEMPSIERGARWLARFNGQFVAINAGEPLETVTEFLASTPLEIQILLDPDGVATSQWGVEGLPLTFIVDPEGNIAYTAKGARDWSDPALLVPLRALGFERK